MFGPQKMIYYSKKDWWLVGAALTAALIPLALGALFVLVNRGTLETGSLLIIVGALIGAALVALTYPLYYQVTASELTVGCGILVRKNIPLSSIDEVTQQRSLAGAAAWSRDRLRIDYRSKGTAAYILISPDDKYAFMRELARTATTLRLKDNRLIRDYRPGQRVEMEE